MTRKCGRMNENGRIRGRFMLFGDFNLDRMKNPQNAVLRFLSRQCGLAYAFDAESTTDHSTCLDWLLFNFEDVNVDMSCYESYFSDHKPLFVNLKC